MEIKVPPQIKIGSHTYSIYHGSHLLRDNDRHGEVNHRTQCIHIETDNPVSLKSETLLHEIIHIGQFCYRISIEDSDIDRIAETIMQFLQQLGITFDWSDIPNE